MQQPQRLQSLLQPLRLMRCFIPVPAGWGTPDAAAAVCQQGVMPASTGNEPIVRVHTKEVSRTDGWAA